MNHSYQSLEYDVLFGLIAQQRYPDLPLEEAYAKHSHDVHVERPAELASECAAFAKAHALDLIDFAAIATGNKYIQMAPPMARIAKNAWAKNSATSTKNADTPTDSASCHQNTTTEQDLLSAIAGQAQNVVPETLIREIHGIHIIGNSLVDRINYYGRWMQTVTTIQIAQQSQVIQALNVICDHLRDANAITVSGGSGPDGFARPVYDFIEKKTNDIDPTERQNHRYFLYHPDTNWYGAFGRLIRERPLPAEFCAKSDNLDTICQFMGDMRQALIEDSTSGKDIKFHLLIPSWYKIAIREPLHFHDSLQPFTVEGEKHKGKELVEMNLPAAPPGMLDGIANVLDPNHSNTIAEVASVAVTGPTVGWGINGACLALGTAVGTFTGIGPLIAVPIWFATAAPAMQASAPIIHETVHSWFCEEPPRILGSTERLGIE